MNRDRYPALIALTLELARDDALGEAARWGITLPIALDAHYSALQRVAAHAPNATPPR